MLPGPLEHLRVGFEGQEDVAQVRQQRVAVARVHAHGQVRAPEARGVPGGDEVVDLSLNHKEMSVGVHIYYKVYSA